MRVYQCHICAKRTSGRTYCDECKKVCEIMEYVHNNLGRVRPDPEILESLIQGHIERVEREMAMEGSAA